MTYMIRIRAHQEEDARLEAEWIETRQKKDALQAELNDPTTSRLYDAQVEIVRETAAAGAKCHDLLVKLRAHRKGYAQFQTESLHAPLTNNRSTESAMTACL
jgi:hypothetical protein